MSNEGQEEKLVGVMETGPVGTLGGIDVVNGFMTPGIGAKLCSQGSAGIAGEGVTDSAHV